MKKLVVFTGAGVSADSGLATFRDSDGTWGNYRIEEVCIPEALDFNRRGVIRFYNERRAEMLKAEPNAAHRAIAGLERDFDVRVITQNVDNLHERAGSTHILHLHGELTKLRSTDDPSLILPFDAEIPEGFEVYSCTGTEVPVGTSTALVLEKAESIEAHTPYIIKGKDGDTHDFSDYGMALQDQYAAGLMTGTFTQQKAVTNTYVLQNQEGKVGFYKVAAGSEPTIKPYRAYINADVAEANIVALLLPGIETGINGIVAEDALVNVYDLNGILVRENVKLGQALEGLSKGIYIVNGTKKAVK